MKYICNKSGMEHIAAITKCESCGLSGYIFFDQLPKGKVLKYNDVWFSKCCNGRGRGEKRARITGWVPPERAVRLQRIRRRGGGSGMSEEHAIKED